MWQEGRATDKILLLKELKEAWKKDRVLLEAAWQASHFSPWLSRSSNPANLGNKSENDNYNGGSLPRQYQWMPSIWYKATVFRVSSVDANMNKGGAGLGWNWHEEAFGPAMLQCSENEATVRLRKQTFTNCGTSYVLAHVPSLCRYKWFLSVNLNGSMPAKCPCGGSGYERSRAEECQSFTTQLYLINYHRHKTVWW